MRTKFPATVMVLDVVEGNEGDIMTSPFFHRALVNADADTYVETLQTMVVKPPWIDGVANGGRPCILQQDFALFHIALTIHDWMAENFHHHVIPNLRPPASPDPNSFNYFP
ncbi:unnamed protein product [Hymenolepis diminuta]|uniref:Extracellular metalloproteinase n=1 Tax=Hymenolepis diminuta TaxID=6216 RepID=A0A0R3SJ03_HYMDI|nr:unnamed protein product [Hymenolepis diminuta]